MIERKKTRLISVDFMRGVTIAWMILANNPGDTMHVYPELLHAKWNGWTITDFVFPIFLFLMGVSVALAVNRQKVLAHRVKGFWAKAARRAAILFALGIFMNAFPYFDLEHLRIPGVLQRIALVYLGVVWLHVRLGDKGLLTAAVSILAGYWLLLRYVPVPGLGYPDHDLAINMEGWLDQKLLHGHIWEYDTTWDPEGVLSTFPALAMGLIGTLCGRWLKLADPTRLGRVFFYGFLMHMGGLLLHLNLPINKNLFTSSFVLFVGGAAVMLLVLCYWRMDVLGKTAGTRPFLALGVNSLAIYIASEILAVVLYQIGVPAASGQATNLHSFTLGALRVFGLAPFPLSLAWSLGFLGLLFLPAWALHKHAVVIKFA
jgi:predicted acyltransferase